MILKAWRRWRARPWIDYVADLEARQAKLELGLSFIRARGLQLDFGRWMLAQESTQARWPQLAADETRILKLLAE